MSNSSKQSHKSRTLEEILDDRLNASHQFTSIVRTKDGITLYDKSKEEVSGGGVIADKSVRTLTFLDCGCEYRGQPTIKSSENFISCDRHYARCYICKRAMVISRSYRFKGYRYCRWHYYIAILLYLINNVVTGFKKLLETIGRYG